MGNSLNLLKSTIINNKYKIMITTGTTTAIYMVYRRYLKDNIQMMRDLYNQMKEFENGSNKVASDKVVKFLEGSGANNLILKLLEEVKLNLTSTFKLDDLFEKIQSSPKESKQALWNIFKNLSLIEFYCSVFITRTLLILTQTQFIIIEKMKIRNENSTINTYYDIYNSLLINLWELSKSYIKSVLTNIESQLSEITRDIVLQNKYNYKTFITFIDRMRGKIEFVVYDSSSNEFYISMFKFFFTEVEKKIEDLEKIEYNPGIESLKTEIHLEFFNNFYDIISSNLFQTVLINGLDYDFKILNDTIELNFETNADKTGEIVLPKIVSFMVKIKNQILDKNNSIFLLKNYKSNNFNEELKEFFNIIY